MEEFKIIVCRECRFAIVPDQVAQHMKNHHPSHPSRSRPVLQKAIERLQDIAHRSQDVKYPPPDHRSIPGLPIYKDGLKCTYTNPSNSTICGYICQSESAMKLHCRGRHGWKSSKTRGGSKKQRMTTRTNEIWEKGVWNQRFFEYGPWKKHFQIKKREDEEQIEEREQGRIWADRYHSEMEKRRECQVIEGEGSRYEANPWLEMTGWVQHLAGFEKKKVINAIRPTEGEVTNDEKQAREISKKQKERRAAREFLMIEEVEEEERCEEEARKGRFGNLNDDEAEEADEGLFEASMATARMNREVIQVCQHKQIPNSALEYIDRPEFGGRPGWKPFHSQQKVASIRKYSEVWIKILRYLWRTADLETGERPRYRLTEGQRHALNEVKEAARQRPKGKKWREWLDGKVEEFWMTMIDHMIKGDHHENGLLSGLAILGLNTESGGWAKPENFTTNIAAIVTISKALIVQQAQKETEAEVAEIQESEGCDEDEAKGKAKGVFDRVQERVQGRMAVVEFGGKPNVMDRLLRMLKYGREIRNRTKGEGRVRWEGDVVIIDQLRFSIKDLRTVVHGLVETAKKTLRVDLMRLGEEDDGGEEEMPKFDLGKIKDAPGEMTEGFNFLSLQENEWEVDGYEWMSGRLNSHFGRTDEEGRFILKEKVTNDWISKLKRFKEELFVLVHLTGGAPARGSEIVSIKSENGPDSKVGRGVFVDRGLVSFVTTYNKTSGMSKKLKTIHRYVPREVGELVVHYLWLIEPFARQLDVFRRDNYDISGYIWEPEPEEDWDDYEEEEGDDDDDDKMDDTNRRDRDGEGADERWQNMVEGSDCEEEEDGGDVEGRKGRRGGKRKKNGKEAINLDGYWGVDRRRRVISREVDDRIGVRLTTALWRQAYPAIQRNLAGDEKVRELVQGLYEEGGVMVDSISRVKIRGKGFNAREEQAGHSRWMEELIYGLLYNESPNSMLSEREEFRKVSLDWHRILHFKSGWEDAVEGEEVRKQAEMRAEAETFMRWKRMKEIDLEEGLKMLNGPDAKFRGLQKKALKEIIAGNRRVMVIMGTGKGKSLLFMLPAKVSKGGLTIVIVPLNSLRDDMKRRCDEAGIESVEWTARRPPFSAKIVFVTPESAVTKAFGRFIETRKAAGGLDRIVIDECHMIMDASHKWRPKMLELVEMMDRRVQVIFLTATMRPKDEEEFFGLMGLKESEVMKLREKTARENIVYQVMEYNKKEEIEEVKGLVDRKLEEYQSGKIIIYCESIDKVGDIADVVRGQIYNAQMGNEEMKKKVLERMRQGDERVWVATNALGVGIDIPNIRVVIHVGVKRKVRDYVQESGRGGRDGQRSEGIIMRSVQRFGNQTIGIGEGWVEEEMKELVKGEVCRRKVIDREMDGRGDRWGCEIGEERCDVCQGRARGGKRRRMVVNNDEEDLRATQVVRVREREQERVNRLYDLSSDKEDDGPDETRTSGERGLSVELATSDSGMGLEMEFEQGLEREEMSSQEYGTEGDVNQRDDDLNEASEGWREDGGGWKKAENQELLEEWRKQREGYEMEERRRVQERVGGRELLEELENKTGRWMVGCMVCKAIGGERERRCRGSEWEDCDLVTETEKKAMQMGLEGCNKIMMERFAACWSCWMPREMCRRYNEDGINRGGFKRFIEVPGAKCQYGRTVKEICVALTMFCPSKELERRWEESMKDEEKWQEAKRKHGLRDEDELATTVRGLNQFTKKVNIRGVEMNEGTATVVFFG